MGGADLQDGLRHLLGRARSRKTLHGLRHLSSAGGVGEQRAQGVSETLGEVLRQLIHNSTAAGTFGLARVAVLMIVGRVRIGDQDAWNTRRGQFGQGRATGPTHNQIAVGEQVGHMANEGSYVGH